LADDLHKLRDRAADHAADYLRLSPKIQGRRLRSYRYMRDGLMAPGQNPEILDASEMWPRVELSEEFNVWESLPTSVKPLPTSCPHA
jgi:hypothetical protein